MSLKSRNKNGKLNRNAEEILRDLTMIIADIGSELDSGGLCDIEEIVILEEILLQAEKKIMELKFLNQKQKPIVDSGEAPPLKLMDI